MAASFKLKPLHQQVIVITGASSGIGLTTARMAAREGAKLVLAARNHEALSQLEREINNAANPGTTQAVHVDADVASEQDIQRVAVAALIHNAGARESRRGGMHGLRHSAHRAARRLSDWRPWKG